MKQNTVDQYSRQDAYEIGNPYSQSKETKYDFHMVDNTLYGVYSNRWEQGDKFDPDEWATQLDTTMQASSAGTLIDQLNKLMEAIELLTIELGYQFDGWIDEHIVLFKKEVQP